MSWEIAYGLGALILLGALIYGYTQYRQRSTGKKMVTEQATHEMYHDPEHYDKAERDRLRAEAEHQDELAEDRKHHGDGPAKTPPPR
jgi:hypothetical protein